MFTPAPALADKLADLVVGETLRFFYDGRERLDRIEGTDSAGDPCMRASFHNAAAGPVSGVTVTLRGPIEEWDLGPGDALAVTLAFSWTGESLRSVRIEARGGDGNPRALEFKWKYDIRGRVGAGSCNGRPAFACSYARGPLPRRFVWVPFGLAVENDLTRRGEIGTSTHWRKKGPGRWIPTVVYTHVPTARGTVVMENRDRPRSILMNGPIPSNIALHHDVRAVWHDGAGRLSICASTPTGRGLSVSVSELCAGRGLDCCEELDCEIVSRPRCAGRHVIVTGGNRVVDWSMRLDRSGKPLEAVNHCGHGSPSALPPGLLAAVEPYTGAGATVPVLHPARGVRMCLHAALNAAEARTGLW